MCFLLSSIKLFFGQIVVLTIPAVFSSMCYLFTCASDIFFLPIYFSKPVSVCKLWPSYILSMYMCVSAVSSVCESKSGVVTLLHSYR